MPYDIITIGSATRDAFLVSHQIKLFPSEKFITGVGECVALGTKIDLDKMVLATGGGATNAAVTFGNLGFKTATIARVGQDCSGAEVIGELKQHHVNTSLMRVIPNQQTAYSTLLTEPESGERTVLVYRGVSSKFTKADLPFGKIKTKWIYLTSLGGNVALAKSIVQFCAKQNIRLAWNPGSSELSPALKPLLKHVDLLIVNKEEAEKLTNEKDLEKQVAWMASEGKIRLITDGSNGAWVYRDGWTAKANTTGAKSISRTGAGDAFGSGFLAGFIKTEDLKTAMAVAMCNAESVIQHYGAKAGILKKWPSASQIKKISLVTD